MSNMQKTLIIVESGDGSCKICGGDGIIVLPVKNINKMPVQFNGYTEIPDYTVLVKKCKCKGSK